MEDLYLLQHFKFAPVKVVLLHYKQEDFFGLILEMVRASLVTFYSVLTTLLFTSFSFSLILAITPNFLFIAKKKELKKYHQFRTICFIPHPLS